MVETIHLKCLFLHTQKGCQTSTENCAHMEKKSSSHNPLHAHVKINICIQFTTHRNATDLNMYKY